VDTLDSRVLLCTAVLVSKNGDKTSPFPPLKEFTLCAKLGLPEVVLTLAGEDQAVPMELTFAEDVDVVA
jgi:hypothetical protein